MRTWLSLLALLTLLSAALACPIVPPNAKDLLEGSDAGELESGGDAGDVEGGAG